MQVFFCNIFCNLLMLPRFQSLKKKIAITCFLLDLVHAYGVYKLSKHAVFHILKLWQLMPYCAACILICNAEYLKTFQSRINRWHYTPRLCSSKANTACDYKCLKIANKSDYLEVLFLASQNGEQKKKSTLMFFN